MSSKKNHSTAEAIKQQLSTWLAGQDSIKFAILFGSFAKQTNKADSDIDLAIQLDTPLTADKKLTLLQSLSELTNRHIDLVDLKTVGEPLLSQIIKYGNLLKGSQQDFIELSIKNVYMMEDFTPYIRRNLKEKRERWLNHG